MRPPEPIADAHDLSQFECGHPSLDDWLRRRALKNEAGGGSRTYVVCAGSHKQVVGFYCLAAGAVAHGEVTGRLRRNMPDPIPVIVIGRLAVHRSYHGQGIGNGLLRDAILRTIQAAEIAGIRAILVHAISDEARKFYERRGFRSSPIDPKTLFITLEEAGNALGN
ncbi:MAG: GNAT family N-acetyltransferase [Planctomycetales bacterium]|nr:GNAT family N-acetyltransferase [Planctomycetales bacterium]